MLFTPVTDSQEVHYRDAEGTLLAVSVVDISREALSSVYHYFDPQAGKRSLGVYSVLAEVEWCQQTQRPYYYLGYWIEGCKTMEYKAQYRPHELLSPEGHWELP